MTTVAASTTESSSGTKSQAALALKALLVVQIVIGYEWFMSGLTKVVDGGFPSGLADELRDKSEGVGGWYKSFLDGTIIPNAKLFGVLIEVGELAIGIALIGAAIVWLARWSRLPDWGQTLILIVTAAAAVGGIFMAINFHLASGASHPWLIPKSGFDEGVDLDSLLPMIQLVLAAFAGLLLYDRRKVRSSITNRDTGTDARPEPSATAPPG